MTAREFPEDLVAALAFAMYGDVRIEDYADPQAYEHVRAAQLGAARRVLTVLALAGWEPRKLEQVGWQDIEGEMYHLDDWGEMDDNASIADELADGSIRPLFAPEFNGAVSSQNNTTPETP